MIKLSAAAGMTVVLASAVVAGPATAQTPPDSCPDIHVVAVEPSTQPTVDAPTEQDTGELAAVIVPALTAAETEGYKIERTYVPYPADTAGQGVSAAYKSSVLDGYQRTAQVAARVVQQCPTSKLIALGYGQGGQAVSMWAQQVAAGKSAQVKADNVALVVTFGDPTRAADAPLFANRAGQIGPGPWPGISGQKQPSAAKYPDMYTSPTGQGIGPERDIAASFGLLDGRVAQWCVHGDLSCSAPKSISLARAALAITGQSSLDFSRDPFGVAATLAAATANVVGNGLGTFASEDIQGESLADVYFDSDASISKRLEEAADPRNADQQTNPLVGVLKLGQIVMSSVTSFIGQVLDTDVLSSLLDAGAQVVTSAVTGAVAAGVPALAGGPAAAAAAAGAGAAAGAASTAATAFASPVIDLASNAVEAAVNIVPPSSAEKKVSSVFDLLINEVKANSDLPALLMDSRLWSQATTHAGYRTDRVALDGSTPAEITADWIIAAGRDYAAARANSETSKTPPQKQPDTAPPTARYDQGGDGAVSAVVQDRPDLSATAKSDTPNDVRLLTAPTPSPPTPATASPAAISWIPDGSASVAARLVAASDGQNPAAVLLRLGSPVLAAVSATSKENVK